jgi:hypothetical protein
MPGSPAAPLGAQPLGEQQGPALIETPLSWAYCSTCCLSSGGTRRLSDSRGALLTTTKMLPLEGRERGLPRRLKTAVLSARL